MTAGAQTPYFSVGVAATRIFDGVDVARAQFAERRAIICPQALDQDLTSRIMQRIETADFQSDDVQTGLGHRRVMASSALSDTLRFALSRTDLLRWLEAVTDSGPLVEVSGNVVETRPIPDDWLGWHNDMQEPTRRLGVTICLCAHGYEGGQFEMRRAGETAPFLEYRHTTPGTALIFEISRRLQHQLLPLTGGGPRRIFAGWFNGPRPG